MVYRFGFAYWLVGLLQVFEINLVGDEKRCIFAAENQKGCTEPVCLCLVRAPNGSPREAEANKKQAEAPKTPVGNHS